jgi:uncharacterized membrane-anchored protein
MNGLPKPKGEWWFCLALFLLGVVIMVSSVQIGFGRFTRPGAGLFPFFCGLILAAQSLALMFLGQTGQERDHLLKNPAEAKRFVAITAVFVLWILGMPVLGWLPLTFLATLAISKIMYLDGWFKPLLLAVANTAFSYFLFGYLLLIDLPNGFLA